MINIAIVEDETACREQLKEYLKKYGEQNQVEFSVSCFVDGMDFLNEYKPVYHIVLMDIEMPFMNGLDVAERLRMRDRQVLLVFVTNMAQYAIRGYEVNALNFVVKPVTFSAFSYLMDMLIREVKKRDEKCLVIPAKNGYVRLSTNDILYVEVMDHQLIFHTDATTYVTFGTLKKMEETLRDSHFEKCSKSYLVNLRHVKKIEGNMVLVGKEWLQISRPKKKEFIMAMTEYYSVG